ncbi:MAG: DIP1984 family protein [Prevotella sp.]|nr:DIP1984 family protein [Prevotella sp.]
MKLAEALSIRKDLQKRIQQLGQRIQNNVKVQEGDEPSEQPAELMKELSSCLEQLESLIWRINATNMNTLSQEGKTLTELMARKDVLNMRISTLRNAFDAASSGHDRYSRSEIKMVTVIDVKVLGKQIDNYSAQLRKLDIEIQSLNFQTELFDPKSEK